MEIGVLRCFLIAAREESIIKSLGGLTHHAADTKFVGHI